MQEPVGLFQARLRRRSVCRRVVLDVRDSRRSSVDRVASISETVLRIPFRRWAVWNQGLIDFMLKHSPLLAAGVPTPLAAHLNPAIRQKKEFIELVNHFSGKPAATYAFCKLCALR
jgi:hypothetical protein